MARSFKPADFAIGRRIYEARKRKGLSQPEISLALGLAPQTMGEIERGERAISAHLLGRVAAMLGADLTYLVTGERPRMDRAEADARDLARRILRLPRDRSLALRRLADSAAEQGRCAC